MSDQNPTGALSLDAAIKLAINALTDSSTIIDTIKSEWEPENCWSEWDQSVRDNNTAAIIALRALEPAKKPHCPACSDGVGHNAP